MTLNSFKSFQRHFVAMLLCGILLTSQFACGSADLAIQAERVGKVAAQVQPLFKSLVDGRVISETAGAQILSRCQFVVTNAPLLAKAFRENNTTDIVSLSAALIRVTSQIIDEDTLLIPVGPKRTTITALLVAGDIALGIISDNLVKAEKLPQLAHVVAIAQATQKNDVDTIKRFSRRARLVCRASGPIEKYKAGQFVPMSMCKKYPDQTEVQRFAPKPASQPATQDETIERGIEWSPDRVAVITLEGRTTVVTYMHLADAEAQYATLAKKRELSEAERRTLAALVIAIGTATSDQQIMCAERPQRCETTRGVRPPLNGNF